MTSEETLPMAPGEMLRLAHDEADIQTGKCRGGYLYPHFGRGMLSLTWVADDGRSQEENWALVHRPDLSQIFDTQGNKDEDH